MQSAGDRAERLSLFATYFKNPELVNEQVQRYEAVTVADVNNFIRERLGEENRASLLFVPRHGPEQDAATADELSIPVGADAHQ